MRLINPFSLNLITLALLGAGTSAFAADFGVQNANIAEGKTANYQCKRCVETQGYIGSVGVSVGSVDADDNHAINQFGTGEDGAIAGVNADLAYQQSGYKAKVQAHQLGMDNGFVTMEAGKSGHYKLDVDYQTITTNQGSNASTNLWQNNGMLTPSDQTRVLDLALQRQRSGIGFEYDFSEVLGLGLSSYARYDREDKTGHRSASLTSPTPTNFAEAVDETTDKFSAGVVLDGANWLSELSYNGSRYDNNMSDLSLPYAYDVYSATPDNQAHQVSLSGQYRLASSVFSGRVVTGRMIQDQDLIQMSGNPIQNWDGQVDTLSSNLAASTRVSSRLRLGASYDYSKRDNRSSVFDFAQYEFNSMSGAFKQNVPMDIERQTFKTNASYRIASGYRLQAGYDYKQVERSYGEREETRDNEFWSKLNIRAIDKLTLDFGVSYGERGGSDYQANELTSDETESLMRKYNLADRKRTEVNARASYAPLEWLTFDVSTYYANDDYDATEIGLTQAKDYGYDMNVHIQVAEPLSVYAFAGLQWIDSDQNGDQASVWHTEVNDEFINLGLGATYSGLMDGRLILGSDYLFANSSSNTGVNGCNYGNSNPNSYGSYYSYNHSVSLYGQYLISEQMAVKLAYQFERYFDTDSAAVTPDSIPGLITLGDLNHNYNAHQLMLTFSYKLK
ncbi:MtrB/PioB family decaheme-associated outer membrane protein [Shewanella marinintestina]|uniref:MtrB/PioB family decaheme-associated outer membrane protein n=1 Tax=Shewanella marinintestina TaxID=190305 RepID=UPI00200FAEA9|nr:MtrB/PioB family decaheme-associated outer membrane protein [Shewanella marinintestina]MCL1147062.1 MtrB/PioB family decaheme-associated outer membrane protein [Shewanella marinintestina]